MTRKIVTSPTHSPLPTRDHDWCAHYDGEEEAGNYGYGATEAEAVADFIENSQNAWDRIGTDPRLANALRKLSIHEIRMIIGHAQARHDAALKAILSEPHGCRFCDYGNLRNPDKPHDSACGFFMAKQLIASESQP